MNLYALLMIIIALLEIALGIFFLTKSQRSPSIKWYTVFIFSVAGYVTVNAMVYINLYAPVSVHFLQWYFGAVATSAILMFAVNFPFRSHHFGQLDSLLFWLPVILFIPIIFFGNFIQSLGYDHSPAKQNFGSIVYTYAVFFLLYWGIAVYHLLTKLRTADGIHRWQIRTFLMGAVAIPLTSSIVFDIAFPIANIVGYGWIGSTTSIIWLGFTCYIILKK